MAHDAYVALGSNLGDRMANLLAAVRLLDDMSGLEIRRVSQVYESEPWGVEDQPAFANAVALLRVHGVRPDHLLARLKEAEETLGREPGRRYGPRVIDLDLLLFDDEEWASPELTLPHPRMLERDFVVRPLLEIAPDVRLPDGRRVADAARPKAGRVLEVLGQLPGSELLEQALPSTFDLPAPDTAPDEPWVEIVAEPAGYGMGHARLSILAGLLAEEGVPALIDPPEPAPAGISHIVAFTQAVRLLVPARFERRARDVLASAEGLPGEE